MAVCEVVLWPNPILKTICDEVPVGGERDVDSSEAGGERDRSDWFDQRTTEIAQSLIDTMRAHKGCVGIAAPQIGHTVRMIAIDVTGNKRADSCHGELVLVNPVVASSSTDTVKMREGCLSIPDFTGNVVRAQEVSVDAFTAHGPVSINCNAWEARVLLHELDHLDGVLFLDRVRSARDVFPRKKY